MNASPDLGVEGNTARRLFWERVYAANSRENAASYAATQADLAVAEWDDRWIAEDPDDESLLPSDE